ncbi:MAG: acyl-CoA mutase large subunit family protein [Anaerolineaceae bacterium]|nr:acyl-CoA mutase large subunit family protein [Anaerolineaceae bacterium]
MAESTPFPHFDEFKPASHEDWQAAAEALLPESVKLESLIARTNEGYSLNPLYSAEHSAKLQHPHYFPSLLPRARGRPHPWLIVQSSALAKPEDVNRELREGIRQGSNAIQLFPDFNEQGCQAESGREKLLYEKGGNVLQAANEVAVALDSLPLEDTPLLLHCGPRSLPLPALLVAGLRQSGIDLARLRGSVGADPLAWLAKNGASPAAIDALYDEQAAWLCWSRDHAPNIDAIFLDSCVWHEAGGNAVQEIACSLANATATLRAMLARGIDFEEVAPRIALSVSLGSNFLMELAKLRALRLVWAQMIDAFGGQNACQLLTIHARTGRRNKSALDPWCNMLRSTFEALTGALGGCDSLLIEPFDAMLRLPDELARRHARNQQHILQHEAGLARLLDPAGGSWTLEAMTDWLAREAWGAFQDIERRGGLLSCLRDGSIQRELAAVAQQRSMRNARRRDVQVGSNQFVEDVQFDAPDPPETCVDKGPNASQETPSASVPGRFQNSLRHVFDFETLVAAAHQGANLAQLLHGLPDESAGKLKVTPLTSQRLSAPWEALRANASAHHRRSGRAASAWLALCGEAATLHARASFVCDFFCAGGFKCEVGPALATAQDAAAAALSVDADLIVLCADDANYPAVIPAFNDVIRKQRPDALIYLAGRPPGDLEADWREAGIDGFVHMGADCLAINRSLQQRLGLAS